MKRTSTLLVVLLAAALLAGCRSRPDPGPGEARLASTSGRVETSRDGRTWHAARTGMLHRGDRVRARGTASRAVLELHRGASVELRSGSQVLVRNPLRLVTGDLLVRAGEERLRVDGETATADVVEGGAARFTRSLALDVGVYEGSARITSAGRPLSIPALRQASVAGPGLVPSDAQPLRVRDDDRWDREFLGQWIDLGRDLQSRSTGLTGQLGPDAGATTGFYQLLLPDLARQTEFTQALLDDGSVPRTPGERLVGAAITVAGDRGSFADRWHEVFAFRSDGAEWGIVAADQHLHNAPHLVTTVDQALARAVGGPEVATARASTSPGTASPTTSGAGSPPANSSTPTSSPSPTTTVFPGTPPTTQPPVAPVIPTLPTLPPPDNTTPAPSPSSSPTTTTPIGQVTDTLIATVGGILDPLQP